MQYAYPDKFTYNDDPINDHIDVVSKGTVPVGNVLRESMNMYCDIIQVDSYGWLKNGTFNGAIGLFQQGRIKATAFASVMFPERLPVTEFTGNVWLYK